MPVPHLLHVFPTLVAAGAQTRVVALVEGFGAAFRHSFVALDGRSHALERLPATLDVRSVSVPRAAGPLGGARALVRLLDETRPDLVLTYNWGSFDAVLAARRRGARHVHHEDGFNADEASRQKARRVLARRYGLRRAECVVVPSRVLERIALEVWRLSPSRVRRVPNGIDTRRFRAAPDEVLAVRRALGIPAEALLVGAVGHLRAVKAFPRLVEACAALPDLAFDGREVHLAIVGEGEERGAIEARAAEAGLSAARLHLPGHQDDLAPWYRAMDVFAISSDSEQHPVSLLEAMASEVPVAATDVGDVREVLGEAAGALVPPGPGAARGLTRALAELLSDPERRARLGALGRARVEEGYTFEAMLAAYRTIYDRALARGARA